MKHTIDNETCVEKLIEVKKIPIHATGESNRTWADEAICCCSVTELCQTLCDPMDCSVPGSPVLQFP